MRIQWQQRIADLDPVLRARLGAVVGDDVVTMEFLREDGDPAVAGDWKPLTAGSPGQRSAAMLSFVMHHGVDPLVLDQPEDDLDTEWITQLVVRQLRTSRWTRQLVVVTHNANIPVNADAERIIVMENHDGGIRVRQTTIDGKVTQHVGALEQPHVRRDIQQIMEGGVVAFMHREKRYNNELNRYRAALQAISDADESVALVPA
jgi:ATPase subunit of ABC transporter with duplicated ATPase domains